ncbi:MAG TPA: asparaginase [Sulfurovum sp.]|nr:asparaginase [Sulfurovum sp.]
MHKILLISTGGTFNKYYSEQSGKLEIDTEAKALQEILHKWRCTFEIKTIIDKDSLDINGTDRQEILEAILDSDYKKIIVIHGTDTMDKSAKFIAGSNLSKQVVFTGAMIPYSIDSIEATANLASAIGYIQDRDNNGVYISMNGIIGSHNNVFKNRDVGRFELL